MPGDLEFKSIAEALNQRRGSMLWIERSFGPSSYQLDMGQQHYDLAKVNWDVRTGLLDNLFPITELRDPQGRFVVRLVTFAPVSVDGTQRLRVAARFGWSATPYINLWTENGLPVSPFRTDHWPQ